MRAEIDRLYPDKVLLAEANQWPEDVVDYLGDPATGGDECHMAFHFPVMPRLFMAVRRESRYPISDIMDATPPIPSGCQWGIFLRNHDELTLEMVSDEERDYMWGEYAKDPRMRANIGIRRRLAPLLDNDRRQIELFTALLLSLPGSPVMYYGDEIGMGDNIWLGDRDGVRTPMQWTPDRNSGFSTADPGRLVYPPVMDAVYGYQVTNVESQLQEHHLVAALDEAHARRPAAEPVLRRRFLRRPRGYEPLRVLVRADLGRASGDVRQQPLPQPPARRARPPALRGHQPGRAPRRLALPRDRRAPLPAHPRRARLLLAAAPMTDEPAELPSTDDIARYLSGQRWFAGRDGAIEVTGVRRLATLLDHPSPEVVRVDELLVDVRVDGGASATYQLAVEWRHQPIERLEHVHVGTGRDGTCYDAFHDRDVTHVWPDLLAAAARTGDLTFNLVEQEAGDEDSPITRHQPSTVSTAEQSNTSLVYGDEMIIKAYRRIVPGVNPDVEVHVALAKVGCVHIAKPLGWVDSPDGVLAFAQQFLNGATEGWESAQASVRDLFVEADLHPGEVGGDFAGEAERLGATTAEVHAALREAFPTGLLTHDDLVARVELFRSRLREAVAHAPVLAPFAARLGEVYDELEELREPIVVQRVHGDFHLGQTLRTPSGWKVLDFEGEPATSGPQRRASDTPLRDVAGMLRSLDYAARMVLLDHPEDQQRAYRAAEWSEWNAAAFCRGYASVAGHDPRDDAVLLRALETDKAVYEVVYESRMRPTWTAIPMAAIERLAQ